MKAERVHTFCGPMMKSYPSWDRTWAASFVKPTASRLRGILKGRTCYTGLKGDALTTEEQEAAESTLKPAREKLLAARERRVKPLRDSNILTSWNAMMISAMFDAAVTLNQPTYRLAAEKALTFLLDYAFVHGRVYHTVVEGRDDSMGISMTPLG